MNLNDDRSKKPTPEQLKQWARVPEKVREPLMTNSEFTPEEVRTPRLISGHPVIKIALVAGVTLPIFVVAGLALNANRPVRQAVTQPNPISSSSPENSDAKTIAEQREALGKTQASYALKEQHDRFKQQATSKQVSQKNKPNVEKTPSKPVTRSVAATEVPPARAISYSPTPVVPRVRPTVGSPVQPIRSTSEVPVRETPQDTYDRYLALTQLGSYGQILSDNSTAASSSIDSPPEEQSVQEVALKDKLLSPTGTYAQEEAAIIEERPQTDILATTKTEGILKTPIVFDGSKTISKRTPRDRIAIQITEPLKAQDASIALPEGTQLIAQLSSLSNSGLVELQVISAVINQNGQQVEVEIPPEAIQITGQKGQPLIAKRYGDMERTLSRADADTLLLGALNGASEQLTQSQSSSIISSGGSIISSTQNSKPNILAGIIRGGSQALLNSIFQRKQRLIQDTAQQSNIRFLPAGSSVEIHVNQTVSVPVNLTTASINQSQEISDAENTIKNVQEPIPTEENNDRSFPLSSNSVFNQIEEPQLIPKWSISNYAETSPDYRSSKRQSALINECTSNLTCQNDSERSSTRTLRYSTDDSRLGRLRNELKFHANRRTYPTGLARRSEPSHP